jgi:hypothetical protein
MSVLFNIALYIRICILISPNVPNISLQLPHLKHVKYSTVKYVNISRL